MENRIKLTDEDKALLEAYLKSTGSEQLSPEDLDSISGGDLNMYSDGDKHVVDMSDYTAVFYSLARGAAAAYSNRGYSREAAIQAVKEDYENNYNIVMLNLDQCITQEFWDRLE